jgi:hypothetical protein
MAAFGQWEIAVRASGVSMHRAAAVVPAEGVAGSELLRVATAAEQHSGHPLA